ncbi:MAG: ADP-ribosylglycohydrolase family protein [Desulfomonilia bacterium]|jgi:ADP-ribosylglycohydrolase|nr:ADP-ribosylglycohydrolase family protein [Pseudomonadota bacterium]HON39332.1 ADP-ribosylglycohydrolase family protein [Deltaproteobacteria bacterium]HRS57050.1 ADP-ribosylglycohydrolase family protein [Desulfomonilia bacterium]HPD22388.1 ADP-ribosylglycohydrolase family protein [Deltaproteobacteria bacterium]HPX17549.1 ADP-ribosylglycohydrolase family protein [Deltaproteobacteria bacterium]
MSDKARAMVLGSFIGDSLALGAHWIHSTERIVREYGRIETFVQPTRNSYHKNKKAGEFTHYGDQTFVLLKSLAECGRFDLDDFSARWQDLFSEYNGYMDKATRSTFKNLVLGKSPLESGSQSDDLSGASRIAPLVYALRHDPEGLVNACRLQASMTHGSAFTIEAGEFFARVCLKVLAGASPVSSMNEVVQERFRNTRISDWVNEGIASRDQESVEAIVGFGQGSPTTEAFPSTVHLIARYEHDLREALIQSVMAGGDSAARGMIAGMVLGAHLGMNGIPEDWVSGLAAGKDILAFLTKIG